MSKWGQPPVVDVFAQVIVAVIVHVHVHVHMEGAGLGLLQDVAHAAQDAVAPPVVIVAVKTVQPGKKGGAPSRWGVPAMRSGGRYSSWVTRTSRAAAMS